MSRKRKQSRAGPDLPPRVAIWCAVSSKRQAKDDKVSLPEQERMGRAWAAEKGLDVAEDCIFRVPGHTREYFVIYDAAADMPAYQEFLDALKAGRFKYFWALDEDRVGRTNALILQVIGLAEAAGAEVYIHNSPHELGNKGESQLIVTSVKGAMAEQEMYRLRQKHDQGMKGRIEGRGMLPNHPPFGYSAVRSPDTGRVVRYEFNELIGAVDEVTRLYLAGVPRLEIARRMQAAGTWPTSSGSPWSYGLVCRIVDSDVYGGYPSWGPYKYKSETPSAKFPARWNTETYAAMLRERERRTHAGYTRRGAGPFTGVARCRRCGNRMARYVRKTHAYELIYLRCANHALRTCMVDPGSVCPIHNNIAEWRIVQAVTERLAELQQPEVLDAACATLEDTRADRARLTEELEEARATAAALVGRRTRLALDRSSEVMDEDVYQSADAELKSQLEAALQRAAGAEKAISLLPDAERRRADLAYLAAEFPALIAHGEPAAVAALLQRAGVVVWVDAPEAGPDRIVVEY